MIFWDTETGKLRSVLHELAARLRISPDGDILAYGASTRLKLMNFATMEMLAVVSGHRDAIQGIDFSPDGKTLVTASWDGTAKFWHVATGHELFTYRSGTGQNWCAAFSRNGNLVAVGGGNSRSESGIALLRAASEEQMEEYSRNAQHTLTSLSLQPRPVACP